VVDFDLRTWLTRSRALRVPATLGRVPGEVLFQQDQRFTRQSRAVIPGRMVLDGIPLVRDAVRLDDYRLETAARAILGRGKRIDTDVPDAAAEIERLYREEPEALVAYNREDARLVLDILEREGLLALAVERSLLSGMQLDRVGASIASFDLLYLPALRRSGFVAPCVDGSRKSAGVAGGAVLDSKPGMFSNVAVFDFKSLYPSLIRTFNLDPLAHARARGDAIEAPNGARFSREEAILPAIIERFMASREQAKQRGERHADQAIKIMMNALFGVLGAASCRFFDPDVANAITGFGQQTLHWTREAFEASGVAVLYGDTDSVFIQLRSTSDGAARTEAEELRADVEARVAARIRDAYRVEPRLDLELERIFARFFMPRVRGGRSGSKKRYAGLHDGHLEVVGLESVRRDWPAVAKRLQRGLLERAFADREVMPFVREVVAGVRSGDLDAELVYRKRVRKRSIESYTASTPPHVQAARKAGGAVGSVVRYVVEVQLQGRQDRRHRSRPLRGAGAAPRRRGDPVAPGAALRRRARSATPALAAVRKVAARSGEGLRAYATLPQPGSAAEASCTVRTKARLRARSAPSSTCRLPPTSSIASRP
jgi:DNA polymerase-2